jgi:uncharacterized protein YbjT (DUF2867 family)
VRVSVGDLNDPATPLPAMADVEGMFLLTSSTRQDENVLTSAAKAGVRRVVKLSTQEAGWVPVEGHGHWHREREQLIQASGLDWTFLRPTMFMNAALQWAATIKSGNLVAFPMGDGCLAPIDPCDVAAVAVVALTTDGHTGQGYELTGGQLLACAGMVEILAGALGRPLTYTDLPNPIARDQMLRAGMPPYVVDGLLETFGLVRNGRFAYTTPIVERLTGHPPRTFEQWCRAHSPAFN